ncbi:uracil-DNA glycosylase [Cryobacterium tepidiphilum]|uniref:Uracil-DNA glycosylase n=1 Tax=Cryobacterium tepidiphilum TaxID=2486026 RepID=A0A3M8LI86_9MICO|nr:uracil-DNA glycosylase [Cryobacterium tepidiphilum]RNE64208.1 uracil-DNA glycosylase [Cryobacterium tepidiphilum]
MTRRMADPTFLAQQRGMIYAPQVKAINELCDQLMKELTRFKVPYVAPHYNAETARILALSSNPGPQAGGEKGSGFLSIENNDGSAERMGDIWNSVGLSDADVLPWNAYPWHVHESHPNGLTTELIDAGLEPLKRVLELYPRISAVIAHGGDAHRSMRRFVRKNDFASFVHERGIRVWETRHTSNRAYILSTHDKAAALDAVRKAYREAMRFVGLTPIRASPPARVTSVESRGWASGELSEMAKVVDVLSREESGRLIATFVEELSPAKRNALLTELIVEHFLGAS